MQLSVSRMPEHACPAFRYDPLHGDYYLTGKKMAAVFLRHFILKLIFLPRQARDKHRESTQNKDAFLHYRETSLRMRSTLRCNSGGLL